jgi:hypothetical protein
VTEPPRDHDAPLEQPAREAARGRSERTPLLLIGGVGGTIAVVAGILIVIMVLVWRFG